MSSALKAPKASRPSPLVCLISCAGWGGVLRSERRECFTMNPYWAIDDRQGWVKAGPEWMASVQQTHELLDTFVPFSGV